MIDMLTQLGVQEIFPLACEHSVTRYSENLGDKWRRAAIEACKQSHNPWVPIIHQGHTIEQLNERGGYCMAFADSTGVRMPIIADKAQSDGKPLLVLIGPEGGFSKSEVNYFAERKIESVSLGNYILRTEAATIAAMAQFTHHMV